MSSPTTVTSNIADGNYNIADDNYELPYFTPPELGVIQEWVGDDDNNVTAPDGYKRLLRILWDHFIQKTQPPPNTHVSFVTRLYTFGFHNINETTRHTGTPMNNPLAEMVTLIMLRKLAKEDPDSTDETKTKLTEKLIETWDKFMEYLNLGDDA